MTAFKPAPAPKMTVPFYGHARQYYSIKSEIDEAFHAVIESESYVWVRRWSASKRNSPTILA